MEPPLLGAELSGCVVTTSQAQTRSSSGHHVSYTPSVLHGIGGGSGDGPWSCSGVILDATLGLVLCQGAVFFPFVKECSPADHAVLLSSDFPADLSIQVEFPLQPATDAKPRDHSGRRVLDKTSGLAPGLTPMSQRLPPASDAKPTDYSGRLVLDKTSGLRPGLTPMSQRAQCPADLLMLIPCPEFQATFSRLFRKEEGWTFSSEEEKKEYGEFQKDLAYLHWFAVLKLQSPLRSGAKTKLGIRRSSDLVKGCTVFACGSPFGSFYPDIFLNTFSKGVLSNMAGDRNVLLLTDARCLPGSEGGGIYVLENGRVYLVGITVAPLCWKANEWVGLTLACSISHIIENMVKALSKADKAAGKELAALDMASSIVDKPGRAAGPLDPLTAAVVVVDSGQSWGSGVLITSNLVLTCRHVVRGSSKVSVKIWSKNPLHWIYERCLSVRGQVVFSSQESSPYDIAVVKLDKDILGVAEPVLASSFSLGQDVCIVGYGALGERCGPSITSGVLSAVISVADVPVMLQSSCAVHGGSSGGPLFDVPSGELLGIVASNTKDNSTGATYPHLNFSIPITVLREAIDQCRKSGGLKGFEELNKVGIEVRNVWRLQRSPENVFQSKL